MTYNLEFDERALKEWRKLDETVRIQFKKKLAKLLENPHIPANHLHGDLEHCYKIKLRTLGYRLVYYVEDETITILVLSIGKRERAEAYETASHRLAKKISG